MTMGSRPPPAIRPIAVGGGGGSMSTGPAGQTTLVGMIEASLCCRIPAPKTLSQRVLGVFLTDGEVPRQAELIRGRASTRPNDMCRSEGDVDPTSR